jgi:Domain of unknown function (DUF4919)
MKIRLFPLVVLTLGTLCPAAILQEKPAGASYGSLVQKLKSGDQNIDFKQLRLAYADSPTHVDTDRQTKSMMNNYRKKDFKGALKNAEAVLLTNYTDMDAHAIASLASKELGNPENAEYHRNIYVGLIKSIKDSGDGKTPATAFQVIEVHEEYVMLRAMGAGLPKSQSLLNVEGHSFDAMKVDDPKTHEETTIYFNVDIPFSHYLK